MNSKSHGYPTYSLLGPRDERPSDYEIVSSRLLYYQGRGFELKLPIAEWYERYQQGSPFACADWERFFDPRRTTYTTYTQMARDRELVLDRLFEEAEARNEQAALSEAWRHTLACAIGPLRYPVQGFHMLSCYVGQMAPSGRIAMAALFQAGDELRRIDRLAYRTRLLQRSFPGFAQDAKARWQSVPEWQPLRETIERLLVTYDWGEAFVALNLCLKPWVEAAVTTGFGSVADRAGDTVLGQMLRSFDEDRAWHESWSHALTRIACESRPDTRSAVLGWLRKWTPLADRAARTLLPMFGPEAQGSALVVSSAHTELLRSCGLERSEVPE